MSMTQFAMVEELAFLVKDNLPCKHLVLSVEEALVNFLDTDTSSGGILELEPMSSYNRLLMHRLADIFGFSHQSVGEGDDRHLILERCPETSVPSILVSDILGQYDHEPQSPTTPHQLLRRTEASPVLKTQSPSVHHSLEEREAAYLAARERIFALDLGGEKEPIRQKPRNDPVVARRMIAHALGQRINSCNQDATRKVSSGSEGQTHELNIQGKDKVEPDLRLEGFQETVHLTSKNTSLHSKMMKNYPSTDASSPIHSKAPEKSSHTTSTSVAVTGRDRNGMNREHYKREHLGAAKRMFAHALGMQAGVSKSSELKQ